MSAHRVDEPGYFVVIDADGAEVPKSKRNVPAGRNSARDKAIVAAYGELGPDCYVAFKPANGFR